jgi:hypothetical protein
MIQTIILRTADFYIRREMTMFIPSWVFWLFGTFCVLALSIFFGRSQGDYDFVSPLIGFAIILIAVAFAVGYLIG